MYEYKATVLKVVDGDTLHVEIDLGLDVRHRITVRLDGIDAPEMGTPEGKAARTWLATRLQNLPTITVRTIKDRREKYGRYRAVLWDGDVNLNEALIEAGHAVAKQW